MFERLRSPVGRLALIGSLATAIALPVTAIGTAAYAEDLRQDGRGVEVASTPRLHALKVGPNAPETTSPITRVAVPPRQAVPKPPGRDEVFVLQAALLAKGCYAGEVHGTWDADTEAAARKSAELLGLELADRQLVAILADKLMQPEAPGCASITTASVTLGDDVGGSIREEKNGSIAALTPDDGTAGADLEEDLPTRIATLQAALFAQNCYAGPINGRWSADVDGALKTFASRSKLAFDGLDPQGSEVVEQVLARADVSCDPAKKVQPRRSVRLPKARSTTTKSKSTVKRSTRKKAVASSSKRTTTQRPGPIVFSRPVGMSRF